MRIYNRYPESPQISTFLETRNKNPSATKLSVSMTSTRNPQLHDSIKLPAVLQSRRSASSLTSERNTKFKLVSIDEKLDELNIHVHNTRLDAQQTLTTIRFMHEALVVTELAKHREDLKKQIKGLERLVHTSKTINQERTKQLRTDCGALWDQTEAMRQAIFQIRMRMNQIDDTLGFKNG